MVVDDEDGAIQGPQTGACFAPVVVDGAEEAIEGQEISAEKRSGVSQERYSVGGKESDCPEDLRFPPDKINVGDLLDRTTFPTPIFPTNRLMASFFFALDADINAPIAAHVLPPLQEVQEARQALAVSTDSHNAKRSVVLTGYLGRFHPVGTIDWWHDCHMWVNRRDRWRRSRAWLERMLEREVTPTVKALLKYCLAKVNALPIDSTLFEGINGDGLQLSDILGLLSDGWLNDNHICTGLQVEAYLNLGGNTDMANPPVFHHSIAIEKGRGDLVHPNDTTFTKMAPSAIPFLLMPPHVATAIYQGFKQSSVRTPSQSQMKDCDSDSEDDGTHSAPGKWQRRLDLEDLDGDETSESGEALPAKEEEVHEDDTLLDIDLRSDAGLEDQDDTTVKREVEAVYPYKPNGASHACRDFPRRADGTLERHIMIAYAQWLSHNPEGKIVGIFNHKNKHWTSFSMSGNGALKWMDSLPGSKETPRWWMNNAGHGARQAFENFLNASGITVRTMDDEQVLGPCQTDGTSCGLFALHNAIHLAFGVQSPAMDPALYRLKLFMCAAFGPDIFDEQQKEILWQVPRSQSWSLAIDPGSLHIASDSIEDSSMDFAEGIPVTPSKKAADTQSRSLVATPSIELDDTPSKLSSSASSMFATSSRHSSATPSERTPNTPSERRASCTPKSLVTSAKTLSAISPKESPITPTRAVSKCSGGKVQTLHAFFAIPQAPTPPRSSLGSSPKRRQRSEEDEMQAIAKRRRIEEEKQNALTQKRTPSKSEREGQTQYEGWLLDMEILALDAVKYQCLCRKWIEHVQKDKRKDGIVYLKYQISRKKHHDKRCAAKLGRDSMSSRMKKQVVSNSPMLLRMVGRTFKPRTEENSLTRAKYSCEGLRSSAIAYYTTENALSTERGLLSAPMMNRLKVTVFPYKKWKKTTCVPFTKDELRDLAHGVHLRKFQGKAKSTPDRWTEDEENHWMVVCNAIRRWSIEPKRLRSIHCSKHSDRPGRPCIECRRLNQNDSLRRQLQKAELRQAAAETATPEETLERQRKATHTPKALLHRAYSLTIRHMDNLLVQRLVGSVSEGPGATFQNLAALANEGKLDKWKNFMEVCAALQEVAIRSDDPSGKAMHGMRWSERIVNLAVVLRGYGHRSMQNYAIFRALFPLPSERHVKRVVANRKSEAMASPDLEIESFRALRRKMDRLGWSGPLVLAMDCTKVAGSHGFTRMYAPYNDSGHRVGGHLTGSTLPFHEAYCATPSDIPRVEERIERENLGSKMMRCIYLKPPVPGVSPFLVSSMVVSHSEKAETVAGYLSDVRKMAQEVGLRILSLGSDAASTEVRAKQISLEDRSIQRDWEEPRLTYRNEHLGVKMSCQVFNEGEPLVSVPDPSHVAKSCRNAMLGGARSLTFGSGTISFSLVDTLFDQEDRALKYSDLHNLDRQDDGAALRLFSADNLKCMLTEDGQGIQGDYIGMFLMCFVFGELFDAWLNKELDNARRAKAAFRAHFFLLTWKRYIDNANDVINRLFDVDILDAKHHFIADQTAGSILQLCEAMICLLRAHRDYYPEIPFCPDKHGSEMCEHSFGQARQFDPNFSFVSWLNMQRYLTQYVQLMTSGQFDMKYDTDKKLGYLSNLIELDERLGEEGLARALKFPSDKELNDICETAWEETVALWRLAEVDASITLTEDQTRPFIERVTKTPMTQNGDAESGENERRQDLINQINRKKTKEAVMQEGVQQETKLAELDEGMELLETMASDKAEAETQTDQLAYLLNRVNLRNDEAFPCRTSSFLLGGNVNIPALIAEREKTSRVSKVHTEKKLGSEKDLRDQSQRFSFNQQTQQVALLPEYKPYFSNLTTTFKLRKERWKNAREPKKRDGQHMLSQTAKIESYWKIMTQVEKATGFQILPTIHDVRGPTRAKLTNGSFVILALPREDRRRGQTQAPLLSVGYITGLYRYDSGKHAAIPDIAEPHKLSFLAAKLWMLDAQGGPRENRFIETAKWQGSQFHFFCHVEPTALIHVYQAAQLQCSPEGAWRLDKDSWTTFAAISRVAGRLGTASAS